MRVTQLGGINVTIFEPVKKTKKPRPGVIFYHGGCFAVGSPGK